MSGQWEEEARKVAAAFGVNVREGNPVNWTDDWDESWHFEDAEDSFIFTMSNGCMTGFHYDWPFGTTVMIDDDTGHFVVIDPECHGAKMARGLFTISSPAYTLLCQHGYELTAHEKLEALLKYRERMKEIR